MDTTSPIEVLWNNIIHTFENIDPNWLENHKKAVAKGLVIPELDYDYCRENGLKPPCADPEKRNIYLQQVHLEHLWTFIYSVLVMYEESVINPMQKGSFDGEIKINNELLVRANQLFDWSISLSNKVTQWDTSLPNPAYHHNDREKFYAEKTNGLFQSAVAYLLYHEYAHLILGHDIYFLGRTKADMEKLSDDECSTLIQLEQEADLFALNRVNGSAETDRAKLVGGLPVFMTIFSSLLMVKYKSSIQQKRHPDLDARLANLLFELDLNEDENSHYIYYYGCYAIIMFLRKHKIFLKPETHDTAEEYFHDLLAKLDEIKNQKEEA